LRKRMWAAGECGGFSNGCGWLCVARICFLRFKAKGTKARKTAGLVLEPAQLAQMIDPMFKRLDVAIKHGAGAATTHFVPGAMDLEPFLRRFLAAANRVAHDRIKNFRAASGNRAQPVLAQQFEHFPNREPKNALRQMTHLDGGERLDV